MPEGAVAAGARRRSTPRIPPGEFRRRRQRLMELMDPEAVAVLPAAPDSGHAQRYRQDSDFHYLTGFDEPDAVLVLAPGRAHGESILFCRDRDPDDERWHGPRVGPDAAAQVLGLDDAFPIGDMDDILPGLLEGRRQVVFALGADPAFDGRVTGWLRHIRARAGQGAVAPEGFLELGHLLHDLRLYKSAAELRLMRRAAEITCAAHLRAMAACTPGGSEQDIEAELLYAFLRGGASGPAYPSIVGAGEHACTLHWTRNDGPLRDGDLVLVDAGCAVEHYTADVTRTWPVNGRFTPEQADLYCLVLAAQDAAMAACVPGAHVNRPHELAVQVLADGLLDFGLLDGPREGAGQRAVAAGLVAPRTSHWLGLDVHDVGDYRVGEAWRELEPGMVLTVEPGLYLPRDLPGIPARLAGMGIRIEDDVLVTRDAPEVLTAAAPRTPAAIEAAMAGAA